MNIREQSEQFEHERLQKGAAFSDETRGRDRAEEECTIRTAYQRDRDRIIHCKSFRRLMHKTQVFISPEDDHYRTRLTHTLEVAQIAHTLARALRLNEDLTEAIALGHDLGHTPFGHAGENALNALNPGGYTHYEQSVRVVEKLEKDGRGLNLTWEVRNGIARHTNGPQAATLEGRVVRWADKIAYMNHDIEDAIRSGLLTEDDLPDSTKQYLGRSKSQRITTFVHSIIDTSGEDICMDERVHDCYIELRRFMFANVYKHPVVEAEEKKGTAVVRRLYEYFTASPERLPDEYQAIAALEGAPRAVCDYISGMSDRYAISVYEGLFIPRSWTGLHDF